MKSKEELKKLFENGDKPTQENFWEWQDSYWHKDEKLPTEGNYIPLTGTEERKPLTGVIELSKEGSLVKKSNDNDIYEYSISAKDFSGAQLKSDTASLSVTKNGIFQTNLSAGGSMNSSMNLNNLEIKSSVETSQTMTESSVGTYVASMGAYSKDLTKASFLSVGSSNFFKVQSTQRPFGTTTLVTNGTELTFALDVTEDSSQNTHFIFNKTGLYAHHYQAPLTDSYYVQKKYVDSKITGSLLKGEVPLATYNNGNTTVEASFEYEHQEGSGFITLRITAIGTISVSGYGINIPLPFVTGQSGRRLVCNNDGGIISVNTSNDLAAIEFYKLHNNDNTPLAFGIFETIIIPYGADAGDPGNN